jgi:hypothetical protein
MNCAITKARAGRFAAIALAAGAAWTSSGIAAFAGGNVPSYGRWDGFYFGAALGAGSTTAEFGSGSNTELGKAVAASGLPNAATLSTWSALGEASHRFSSWGGYGGINRQFDNLVLSAELTYNRMFGTATTTSSNTHSYAFASGSYNYSVGTAAQSSITLNQYGTVRGRVGYVAGQFLPYVALGLAVGSADYSDVGMVTYSAIDNSGTGQPSLGGTFTSSFSRRDVITYGGVGALGLDVTILPNLFLRGEWEYAAFSPVGGHRLTVSTFRGGIGLKF